MVALTFSYNLIFKTDVAALEMNKAYIKIAVSKSYQ
jgi:hypothetical protein